MRGAVRLLTASLAAAMLAALAPSAAHSQGAPPVEDGSQLTIYLMTMGYGDQVWERFGHNAIRIVDRRRGTDIVYNWGTFDFDQPNFLGRFLSGNTLYWLQGGGMAETMETYHYLNRSVWVQELDFTPAQRVAIRDLIEWNARPENRNYRYDYYLDNCSTRVRDAIDSIVGGQLAAATKGRLTPTTYRFHTQRLLQYDRAIEQGTMIGLGEVADRPITVWEEMFLPTRMQEHLRTIQITDSVGGTRPLVKSERQLFAATRPPEPATAPNHLPRNLLIGLALGVVIAALAATARRGSRAARTGLAVVSATWAAVSGILGVLLIVGWTATRHSFMAQNENILQFTPLALALVVLAPLAISRGRAVNAAQTVAALAVVIAMVGLVMQALPWFDQVNGDVIALALPPHLALVVAVRSAAAVHSPAPTRTAAAASAVARHHAT